MLPLPPRILARALPTSLMVPLWLQVQAEALSAKVFHIVGTLGKRAILILQEKQNSRAQWARPVACLVLEQHIATLYKILQYTATHCNTLLYTATHYYTENHCSTLQHTATRCNTLQHAATRYNVLQRAATHYYSAARFADWTVTVALLKVLIYCNTLQHTARHYYTATHSNTLQHTATHCNTCNTLLGATSSASCGLDRLI